MTTKWMRRKMEDSEGDVYPLELTARELEYYPEKPVAFEMTVSDNSPGPQGSHNQAVLCDPPQPSD